MDMYKQRLSKFTKDKQGSNYEKKSPLSKWNSIGNWTIKFFDFCGNF